MDWWSLAPYWVPALVAVVAVVVLLGAARSRATRRAKRARRAASSSVDPFYLDSSHMGEPHAEKPTRGHVRFDAGPSAGGKSRRSRQ
ncbi:MAG TPA: hypothetical protein VF814_19605 [Casimicrobiaceae bacterium]